MRKCLALAVAVTFAFLARAATAGTWTIPGTVNTSGLNGTRFVSDLAITNPGTDPAFAILTLVPAGGTAQSLQYLAPGQTLVFRNALQQLWGAAGAFATVVTSTSDLLIRARTYNAAATGTYGVALPVVPDDRFVLTGDSADSLWIAQSADGATGYRTNVAVVFPDDDGGDATVTVFDANGNVAGTQSYSLSSAGFQQFAVGSFAGAVAVGRARLAVTRGRASGYSVVVDNVTGDSSLFSFEDLPAGPQDVLANGVARSNGRNSTFFRTDARIYNPTLADASVTVAFHANQSANPSPQTAAFNIPAGKILDVVDVLASLLSLPVGSAGALRFTSDAPIAVLCRTSNVDPTGASPGTYGAQQKPKPILSFLTSADAGGAVTGVRQGAAFRTNLGFAAGADGASYKLALKSAAGTQVSSTPGSLGAWGWTQPNVQDLFPAVTVPDDATVQVTVTAGSLDVFDSSIDNASGDPVVTPVMALPASIPSSATIGPAGGSVQSADGKFTLKIPAGALSGPTPLSITSAASTAPNARGPAYTISPSSLTLSRPGLVVFSFDRGDVNGTSASDLVPAFQAGANWYSMPGWSTDTSARTVTAAFSAVTLPASTVARRAEAGTTPSTLGLSTKYSIQGQQVVPPGGKSALYTLTRLSPIPSNPSVARQLGSDTIQSSGVTWDVSAGNITRLPTTTPAASYISPACPPPNAQDRVTATYEGETARLYISIFPDLWKLTIDEQVDVPCTIGGLTTLEYHVRDHIEQLFTIDLQTGAVTPGAVSHASDLASFLQQPVACVVFPQCGCSLQAWKEPPGLALGIDGSRVLLGYLLLSAQYRHIGVPLWLLTCTGPNPPCMGDSHPSVLGANDHFNAPYGYIPYQGKSSPPVDFSSPGHLVTALFSAKPTNLNCP